MHQLSGRALPLHYRTSARKLLSLLLWKFLFYLLLCRAPTGNKSPESIQMTIESACNTGGLFSHLLDRVKSLYVKKRSTLWFPQMDESGMSVSTAEVHAACPGFALFREWKRFLRKNKWGNWDTKGPDGSVLRNLHCQVAFQSDIYDKIRRQLLYNLFCISCMALFFPILYCCLN